MHGRNLYGLSTGLFGILVMLSYILPNHYYPWLSFHQEALFALATVVPLTLHVFKADVTHRLVLLVAVLSFLPLLQYAFGLIDYWGDAHLSVLYLLGFGLALHLGYCDALRFVGGRSNHSVILALAWAILVSALVSVGVALHQALQLNLLEVFMHAVGPGDRSSGNFGQANHFSSLLVLGVFAVSWLRDSKALSNFIFWFVTVFLIAGLVLSGSRTPLLVFLGAILVSVFALRYGSFKASPLRFVVYICIYFILGAVWKYLSEAILLSGGVESAVERLYSAPVDSIRSIYWQSMIRAIGERPFFGYGFQQIGQAQWDMVLLYPATHSFFMSSHNLLIDLALWAGVPIALAIVLVFASYLIRALRRCDDAVSFYCVLSIVAIILHSMVEYPLLYSYFLVPFGVWLGFLLARTGGGVHVS